MTITDEMVEQAAEAGYRKYWKCRADKAWQVAGGITRKEWREVSRAALEAALSRKQERPND